MGGEKLGPREVFADLYPAMSEAIPTSRLFSYMSQQIHFGLKPV